MLYVTPEITIPEHELKFSFARSSGPGGQNVNKVNSKVILKFDVMHSNAFGEGVRARFALSFGSRMTADGNIVIMSDRYRDQPQNREDCLEKLRQMLLEVAFPPKKRRKTKPTRASKEKRKQSKRLQGAKKQNRGRIRGDD